MNNLSDQLQIQLKAMGASIIGVADIKDLPIHQRDGYDYGISIAVAMNPATVNDIGNGPTWEYYHEYQRLNSLLDQLDDKAVEIIKGYG